MFKTLWVFFSWHKRNGGGGWSAASFCFAGLAGSETDEWRLLRNEDGAVPDAGWPCKKCDRKKQQKGWAGKAAKKTTKPQDPGAGIFCCLKETCRCCP